MEASKKLLHFSELCLRYEDDIFAVFDARKSNGSDILCNSSDIKRIPNPIWKSGDKIKYK